MILEFVWIKSYGIIKNQGFNFNPNSFYSFDEESGELSKKEGGQIPFDFFHINNDTVSNISALVGANGTGKSTALEFISSFLTHSRPLGGFIVTDTHLINKSDNKVFFSHNWPGKKLIVLTRLELINNYRSKGEAKPLKKGDDTKNNPIGLRILENLVTDTRLIYYSGEVNLQHTNRAYQLLQSMSDEFENSHYTDISDIAMMAADQRKYRTDKAVYSGENPVLAYRSGESQRFIDLMLSEYKDTIPFSFNSLTLGLSFNDIDKIYFETYDVMSFKAITELAVQMLNITKPKGSANIISFLKTIQVYGIAGYFNRQLDEFIKGSPEEHLKIHLFHRLLLRHIREQ